MKLQVPQLVFVVAKLRLRSAAWGLRDLSPMGYVLKKMVAHSFTNPKVPSGVFCPGFFFWKEIELKFHYQDGNSGGFPGFSGKKYFVFRDVYQHALAVFR